jgi:alkanesulfonate monooxygenase SsuD/methylene tetrahydromethanopterin reductase-like flavin-dependent oxidoreductase (luciferase family)
MEDSKRRFRFGVVGESIRSGPELASTARRAEALGYDTLLLRDHFVAEPFGHQLAPLVALTAAAATTRTLRVGSLVLDNDYRHPVLLAVTGLEGFPRPAQRPRPPILVGAGSRRMLGLAGREADIVGILPRALPNGTISEDLEERSPAAIARKVDWVREAAGDRFEELELSAMVTVAVADDHTRAAERLATERGWGAAAAPEVLEMPSVLLGPVDRIVEGLEARRDRYQLCYFVVSDEDMDAFAPVVDRLAGR